MSDSKPITMESLFKLVELFVSSSPGEKQMMQWSLKSNKRQHTAKENWKQTLVRGFVHSREKDGEGFFLSQLAAAWVSESC